jgi:hypothetical protein
MCARNDGVGGTVGLVFEWVARLADARLALQSARPQQR